MTTMRVSRESDEKTKKEYAVFKEKVKRTVFLSELSPVSTSSDITEALSQFGDVISIEIIPNLTIPDLIPQCVLVEMKDSKQAEKVIKEITNKPFMISGMPRPVRARAAQPRMFADRPPLPGTVIEARWVGCSDPGFEVGRKMKQLCEKHTAETLELIEVVLLLT